MQKAGWSLRFPRRLLYLPQRSTPASPPEAPHGDGAQNYMICFERRQTCMILLTNSDNGELAFRPLLETIIGDTVTPWEWEGYTRAFIEESRKHP